MIFSSEQKTSVVMSLYNFFGYTSNKGSLDTQYFYYFNSFPNDLL